MKRYFFIAYTTITNHSISSLGNTTNVQIDSYFNIISFIKDIKNNSNCDTVIVNNIIEISESQYEDLYREC